MKIDLNEPGAWTLESAAAVIGSASDKTNHVQLRVTTDGILYISEGIVGNLQTEDLAFRLETWDRGNGYVGPDAAKDGEWVSRIYKAVQDNWPQPALSYINIY
jgi:hypothetical protein